MADPFGYRRPLVHSGYYQTFDKGHATLVDSISAGGITKVDATGDLAAWFMYSNAVQESL